MTRRLALTLLTLAPAAVLAHTAGEPAHVHGTGAAFVAGFSHPFTGLDHLAAMLAVGVWSATTSKRPWLAPLAFAATLCLGAWLGLGGFALPAVEPMIAASLLVLGLLLATRTALPAWAGGALVAAFALFHGVAHGRELVGGAAVLGMVIATALLHAAGVFAGLALRERAVWLPRLGGVVTALFGASLLIA